MPPPLRARRLRAFTLVEVMVASLIFAVSMTALISVFQTASRSFQAGRRSAVNMQTLRFTADQVARDLRSVYYETDYNKFFTDTEADMAQNNGTAALQRLKNELAQGNDSKGLVPGFVGHKLALRFVGQGTGKETTIEFAHRVLTSGEDDEPTWGAERVRYFLGGLDGTDLYRQRTPVERTIRINPNLEADLARAKAEGTGIGTPGVVAGGGLNSNDPLAGFNFNLIAKRGILPPQYQPANAVRYLVEDPPAYTPPPELIARGVETFEVHYAKYDGQWTLVDNWDSDTKQNRTPEFSVPPTDPQFFEKLTAYQMRATDHLPAYVRLRLGIRETDPERPGGAQKRPRVRTFDTVVWVPAALEVYTPEDTDAFVSSTAPTPTAAR